MNSVKSKGTMKKNLIVVITIIMLTGCFETESENPLSTLSTEHNSIEMTIGDSWLYRRMFINTGIDSSLNLPETLIGYSYFKAVKDTVIDLKNYLIIEGRDYDIEKDSIYVLKKRSAIHLSDTVSMYEFQTGDIGTMSGVLKAAMPEYRLTDRNFGTTILKKINLRKLSLVFDYNPNIYSDFVYPLLFPLTKDSIYTYRDGTTHNALPYRRKFIDIEKVAVPFGRFEAYKFEWLVKEALGIDSMFAYDWIGESGLLKRFWDCGESTLENSSGITLAICHTYDIFEKIGTTDINPDTIIPWGKRLWKNSEVQEIHVQVQQMSIQPGMVHL